eukprot:scaffold119879_cov28-Tisochrysis_lutea.AAC.5
MAPAVGVPVLKLGLLAVKQIAKPIANRAKAAAKESAFFKAFVVSLGRGLHRLSIQMTRLADGKLQASARFPDRYGAPRCLAGSGRTIPPGVADAHSLRSDAI